MTIETAIPGCSDYLITPEGEVISCKWGKRRTLLPGGSELTAVVTLQRDDGTQLRTTVASLLRRAFPEMALPPVRDYKRARELARATKASKEADVDQLLKDGERFIPRYPLYAASRTGDIISLKNGRRLILRQQMVRGFFQVTVCDESGLRTSCTVAALVAAAHMGDRRGTVRLLDGNPADLSVENLAWNEDVVIDNTPEGLRTIPGYDTLFALPTGEIFSRCGKQNDGGLRRLSLNRSRKGYPRVSFSYAGKCVAKPVHVLLAAAFLPPPKAGETMVRHLDGDKENCRVSNLEWGTHRDNTEDAVHHSRLHKVRSLRHLGVSELARRFSVSEDCIRRALDDESFHHNLVRRNFTWN